MLYGVILATFPDPNMFLVWLSLVYVAYYVAVSIYLTMISPRRRARFFFFFLHSLGQSARMHSVGSREKLGAELTVVSACSTASR